MSRRTAESLSPARPSRVSRLIIAVATVFACGITALAGGPRIDPQVLESSAPKRGAAPVYLRDTYPSIIQLTEPREGIIPGALVQRDAAGKQIRRVRGHIVIPNANTPLDAARGFLRANHAVLQLSANLSELRLAREVQSLTGYHMTYEQVYAGVPVFGGQISVHLGKDLAINLVNNELISVTARGAIAAHGTSQPAIQAALQRINPLGGPMTPPVATAGVMIVSAKPVAVWKVTFNARKPAADWEVMVQAQTLTIQSVRNRARYADGQGMVFDPNPVVTSGNPNLADNDNADSPDLNSQRISVALQGLDGSGMLTGQYANTIPTSTQTRAQEPTLNFNYTRHDLRFEEVMSYYHIDTVERYVQSLGFTNINNRSVGADPNGITDDNSFYSPDTKTLTFGSGGVDDAEDSDVIWHEMGHCIQDDQVPGWGQSEESGAMGEGFGDYWAGSHSADMGPMGALWNPYIAEWDATSYNPGNPAYLRRLDSTKHYPEDVDGEVHDDGEMWSASLWQIRTLVGKTRADTMILEAQFSDATDASFEDGALAILAANQALYGGADQTAIKKVFIDRGILTVVATPTNLTASLVGSNRIDLSWTDNSDNEDGFKIERRSGMGDFVEIDSVGPNVTTYSDVNLASDTPFTYRVRSFLGTGFSRYSNEAGAVTGIQTFQISGTTSRDGAALGGVAVQGSATGALIYQQTASPGAPIPDNNTAGIVSTISVPQAGTLTAVKVSVDISHTYIGDLEVSIIPPTGPKIILHNQTGGGTVNLVTRYPDQTAPAESLDVLNGKQMQGTWKLWVRDLAALDTGTLNSWGLSLSFNGTVVHSTTSAANGAYTLDALQAATYTVTPTKAGQTFKPTSTDVTVGPDQSGVDFASSSAVELASVSASPDRVIGGTSATGTVTLTNPALADTTVGLSSDNSAATVPASVKVLSGQTQATFTISTTPVSTDTNLTLSATVGASTKTTPFSVFVKRVPTALSLSPSSVVGGQNSTGTVAIDKAAPAGGTTVNLGSSKPDAVVPATVMVNEGNTQATFTVGTRSVAANVTATISAAASGTTKTASLLIKRHEVTVLALAPLIVAGGNPSQGTVTLNGPATAGGKTVTLSSSNPAATVPASVTVLEGQTSVTFIVSTTAVSSQVTANISATLGVTKSKALTIKPPSLSALSLAPTSVFGGTSSTGTITLNGPAPTGGTSITLTSNNAAASVPASVAVAAGQTSATFSVSTTVVYANVIAGISASDGVVSKQANLTVKSHMVKSVTLTPATLKGGTSSTGKVTLTSPAGPGGVIVTLTSDHPQATVPASVTVLEDQTSATFNVDTSAVAAQVKATIKGIIGTSKGSAVLTINP